MGRVSFSFLLDLLKNNEQSKSNVPKHTLKVFWVTTLVTEKKLKKMFVWHAQWGRIEQEEVIKDGQKRPFLGPTTLVT